MAVRYLPDIRALWDMTPYELTLVIRAGQEYDAAQQKKRIEENELLAFNIGALVMAAVNAPQRFPKTPDEAFGRQNNGKRTDGGLHDFMEIARQLNRKISEKDIEK